MSVLPGYRGSGSTQPSSHHWIVCLNAVWHGPLFCPSVVKSQWTGGVWRDWGGKRIDVREKKIKESGVKGWEEKEKQDGEKYTGGERWKEIKSNRKLVISIWSLDCEFTTSPSRSLPEAFRSIWSGALSSLWYHWRERRPGPVTPAPPPPSFKGLSHI